MIMECVTWSSALCFSSQAVGDASLVHSIDLAMEPRPQLLDIVAGFDASGIVTFIDVVKSGAQSTQSRHTVLRLPCRNHSVRFALQTDRTCCEMRSSVPHDDGLKSANGAKGGPFVTDRYRRVFCCGRSAQEKKFM